MDCRIEKRLIPLKGHYLMAHLALGAVQPFLQTYARQMGFTSVAVGMMGTVQAIAALFFRPLCGYIADRWIRRKTFLLGLLVMLMAAYMGIHLIQTDTNFVIFDKSCDNDGWNEVRYCQTLEPLNECLLNQVQVQGTEDNMQCTFKCDMPNGNARDYQIELELTGVREEGNCLYFFSNNSSFDCGAPEKCRASCSNSNVMQLLARNQEESRIALDFRMSPLIWLFVLCMVATTLGRAGMACLTNSWCYTILENRPHLFGQQRLWGSFGFGSMSLLAGLLVDAMSRGQVLKDYSGVFYLLVGFMLLDMIAVSLIRSAKEPRLRTIVTSVGRLILSPRIVVFTLWLLVVGICTSTTQFFLFWHLEQLGESAQTCDIAANGGEQANHSKTLQGLVTLVQTFGGEIPMFFFAGVIIQRIGYAHVMSLVLASFGARFLLYSWLLNPWWTLPIELLQGFTTGLFFSAQTAYVVKVSPVGAMTTVQGIAGATHEGVGYSLGTLISGYAMQRIGGSTMFRWMGYAALVACVMHVAVHLMLDRWNPLAAESGGDASNKVTDDMLGGESAEELNEPRDVVIVASK